jgi:Undecaprenyl-phosphate glucose phosphotransferase
MSNLPKTSQASEATTAKDRSIRHRAASMDIVGLQALAASVIEQDAVPKAKKAPRGAAKRGPFRPEVWLNTRQRHAVRLVSHYFRLIDIAAVLGLTTAGIAVASPGGLLDARLASVLPFFCGAVALLAMMRSLGLYRFDQKQTLLKHSGAVLAIAATAGALALGLAWLLGAGQAELIRMALWLAASTLALIALHGLWLTTLSRWRASGALTPNVVVVGATRHAERLIKDALKRRDINVLGVFDDRLARSPDSVAGVPVLGDAEALLTHRMTPYVDRIVLAIDPHAQARVRELTSRLGTLPNEVMLLVNPQGDEERYTALNKLARTPLASLEAPSDPDRRAFNKRLQDILIGSLALVLLSPVIGLAALAVKLDSPGPIFFRQRRHGFNHEEIVVWKFRSMRTEAADATASKQVTAGDDRVTRVGRVLRSTSLDELPQLINVLKGEMSLVGPRPHAIGMKTGDVESAQLVADYAHRHRIKPGMTGWAAIHGSRGPLDSAQDVRRRVQLDVDYIERQSFWLDLRIMALTVPVLLGDRLAVR